MYVYSLIKSDSIENSIFAQMDQEPNNILVRVLVRVSTFRQLYMLDSTPTWKVPLCYLNHESQWRPESAFEPGSDEAYPGDQ